MTSASPEDVLADVLPSLIGQHERVAFGTPGDLYTHPSTGVVVSPPDSLAKNWALQASTIWVAAMFLADHITELQLADSRPGCRVIEIGAGAGLPGIAIAKTSSHVDVWLSDYPDPLVLQHLEENVRRNRVVRNCRVVGHAWGSRDFVEAQSAEHNVHSSFPADGFDLIVAADTLWNVETHPLLLDSIKSLLQPLSSWNLQTRRAVLVAGFHTGRYAIQRFLDDVSLYGLVICELRERNVLTSEDRQWAVDRPTEDEGSRRQWIVWIVLRPSFEHAVC